MFPYDPFECFCEECHYYMRNPLLPFKPRGEEEHFSFKEWPDGTVSIYDPEDNLILELDEEESQQFNEDLEDLDDQWKDGGPVGVFQTYEEHLDEFLSGYEP